MIELCKYQKELYDDLGGKEFNNDLLILKKTMDLERKKYLQDNLPGLPSSYLKIISEYDVHEKSIGYISISPAARHGKDIVDTLIKANKIDTFFPKEFMEKKQIICIGSDNDFTVFVAKGSDEFEEGEVILIDEEIFVYINNPAPKDIQLLNKDFEQFLIVAGNLNQVHREVKKDDSNYEEKKQEFLERLKKLNVDEKYHNAWLSLFC